MPFIDSNGNRYETAEEFIKFINDEWEKNPIIYRFWDRLIYKSKNIWRIISPKSNYYELKYSIQRARRGWSVPDSWSLDFYLANVISESATYLKKNNHGWPGDEIITIEGFDDEIQKIIDGFNHYKTVYINYEKSDCCGKKYCYPDECPIFQDGMEAFQKWYTYLWD